uniref:peptidylprolyl isomerase n=1 Tax=Pedobacter sp. TaxID=1411316 RepID=UPI003D7F4419
ETNKGNITLLLYDQTPAHRDAFIKTVQEGLFNDAAFNRVIKSFVSQAGELDETILEREQQQPNVPIKRIHAELVPSIFHKKGALGAGRNDNPEKQSYFTQFYLVAGKIYTDEELDVIAKKRGIQFTTAQRQVYKTIGGTPHLDQNYTVFGEVIQGMDVADAINGTPTSKDDLPITPVTFTPKVLSKREAAQLLKVLHF